MKTRLTPYYINLVYDACLKSFWRKKALSKFLRQSSVAETFISTWGAEESKRDFLDRLFVELPKSDRGRSGLLRMSLFLMDQESFPDLLGWEDSTQKIKLATDAVSKLHIYHSKQQEELQSEEEKLKAKQEFAKRQQEVTRSQQTLQKLNDRLNALGRELGSPEAGYRFQDWFYELKFTSEQVGATDIDSFHKKVTTKADNTMGIMISISGYSSVARQEASGERTPLLLLEHGHIYLVLGGIMGLGDVIDRVRRHASQTGDAYLSVSDFSG